MNNSTAQKTLKEYLTMLYESEQFMAYDAVTLAVKELEEEIRLAKKTAESLLLLIKVGIKDFEAAFGPESNEDTRAWALDTISRSEDNLRKLDEWGVLPWEEYNPDVSSVNRDRL